MGIMGIFLIMGTAGFISSTVFSRILRVIFVFQTHPPNQTKVEEQVNILIWSLGTATALPKCCVGGLGEGVYACFWGFRMASRVSL